MVKIDFVIVIQIHSLMLLIYYYQMPQIHNVIDNEPQPTELVANLHENFEVCIK